MKGLRGYILIMAAAFFWGVSATVAKFLLNRQIETLLLVQTRVSISALLLLAFFLAHNPRLLNIRPADVWRFAFLGIVGVAGSNFTYYFTIKESTVATGILIQYTAPFFVMAYASYMRDERVTIVKVTAAVVSLLGCFLAVGGYSTSVLTISRLGLLTGAGSVVCFAFLNVFSRHLLARYSTWTVTFYSITFASVFWFVVNPPWTVAYETMPADLWGALAVLAVISVLIPHSLYFAGLRRVVPTRAVITSTFEPVVAIVTAAMFLGEYLQSLQVLGAMFVIAAIVILQVRREQTMELVPTVNLEGGGYESQ